MEAVLVFLTEDRDSYCWLSCLRMFPPLAPYMKRDALLCDWTDIEVFLKLESPTKVLSFLGAAGLLYAIELALGATTVFLLVPCQVCSKSSIISFLSSLSESDEDSRLAPSDSFSITCLAMRPPSLSRSLGLSNFSFLVSGICSPLFIRARSALACSNAALLLSPLSLMF